MLQTIRDNSKGVIAGILIGFLVIIFALSGSEALFSGGNQADEVAEVNGEPITENAVRREVIRQRQQLQDQYGDSLPSDMASDERLREPALENLIQRQVLVDFAQDNSMGVSDERLDQLLVGFPQFAGEDGQFDPQRYQQVLRSMGYTPAQYKSVLRQQLLISQVSNGIQGSGFVTADELEQFAALSYQERSFRYMTLSSDRVADEVTISEQAIQEYYDNNSDAFRQPEQVAVDYIELSVDNLMESISIDEQTLRDQYQQEQEAAAESNPEKRVSHILIEGEDAERVEAVKSALGEGANFSELAREHSDDLGSSGQGGDLGFVAGEGLPEPFVTKVEELSEGEVSGPVATEAGTHFIKVTEERGGEEQSFAESRDQIERQLKRVQAENEFVNLMDRLGDLSYNAENLESVAEELGLEAENTGLFSRQGGSGIAGEQKVIDAAFSEEVLERENSSDLLELASDRMVVVKKTDHRDAYIKPLEEVSDQIRAQLRREQIRAQIAERGEALRKALSDGQSMEALAEEQDLTLETAESVRRNAEGLDPSLTRHVFSLPRPGSSPVISGTATQQGYTLVSLSEVEEGQWQSLPESQRQALRTNLRRMQGNREFTAFRQELRENASVTR